MTEGAAPSPASLVVRVPLSRRLRPWIGRFGRLVVLAYLVVLAVGFSAFLRAKPVPASPRLDVPPPAPGVRANLANYLNGGSVAVSGFELFRSHNPIYLIDGNPKPDRGEKWATLQSDLHPFADVRLAGRADVDEIDLELGGAWEDNAYSMRDFRIRCLRDEPGGEVVVLEKDVRGNTEPKPKFTVRCPATDHVRFDFHVEELRSARDVVRMYEIQVWGKLLPR
jgi:hypothetical protein